jgi:hypothetical protein
LSALAPDRLKCYPQAQGNRRNKKAVAVTARAAFPATIPRHTPLDVTALLREHIRRSAPKFQRRLRRNRLDVGNSAHAAGAKIFFRSVTA